MASSLANALPLGEAPGETYPVCGIDIGGTKIETAVFETGLKVISDWRVKTPTQNYTEFLDVLVQQVMSADSVANSTCLVGIGMPGLVDTEDRTLSANIPCANGQKVGRDLSRLLNRPVAVENDCRCFALSEAVLGAGKSYSRVYGAILGTGAAGGFCIEGKLDNGRNKVLGEFGHIPLPAHLAMKHKLPLVPCGCGLQACMEQYISGKGMAFLFEYFTGLELNAQQIMARVNDNQTDAKLVFEIYMELLGYTMAAIVLSHDPDVIVLGGGLSNAPQILQSIPSHASQFVFSTVRLPKFVKAEHGDSSGIKGAALITTQHTG